LYQPKAHDLLQRVGALQAVGKVEALVYQAAAQVSTYLMPLIFREETGVKGFAIILNDF
jgi:hypothetical protein